jgi:hypothetical protein
LQNQPKNYQYTEISGSYELDAAALKAINQQVYMELASNALIPKEELVFEAKLITRGNGSDLVFADLEEIQNTPRLNDSQHKLELIYSRKAPNHSNLSIVFELNDSIGWRISGSPIGVKIGTYGIPNGELLTKSLATLIKQYKNVPNSALRVVFISDFYKLIIFGSYLFLLNILYPIWEHLSKHSIYQLFVGGLFIALDLLIIFVLSRHLLRRTELRVGGEIERVDFRRRARYTIASALFVIPVLQPGIKFLEGFARQ